MIISYNGTAMKKTLSALIVLILLLSGCQTKLEPIASGTDLTFYIATDMHVLADELMEDKEVMELVFENGDGRFVQYADTLMQVFTDKLVQDQPDILIVSGDLTNNGEKLSHQAMAKYFKEIEKGGTRVFVIPGNHDIENPFAKGYKDGNYYTADTVTAEDFEKLYKDYGYGEAVSRDPSGLSYLVKPSEDVYLLMLDSNKYGLLKMPMGGGKLTKDTLAWIEEATKLARDDNAQIITVMHHNLLKHNERHYEGYTLDNTDEVIAKFDTLNLNLVLSGHIHVQDIKHTTDTTNEIYDIVTSSMSVFPMQYGILKYQPEIGYEYSVDQLDVQTWAKETDSDNERLLTFDDFAEESYHSVSYWRAYAQLVDAGYSDEVAMDIMADTIGDLNLHYFKGTLNLIRDELINSEGYALWKNIGDSVRFKAYIINLLENPGPSKTTATIRKQSFITNP